MRQLNKEVLQTSMHQCSLSQLTSLMEFIFLWLTEQLSCFEGRHEIIKKLNPLLLLNEFADGLGKYQSYIGENSN